MESLAKDRAVEGGAAAIAAWDAIIDRHLDRLTIERGLSRNSLEAYGAD